MIQTQNLSFAYSKSKNFVFPDINCQPNDTLLVTGGSGTGKTTFLHLLGGLLTPVSGNVKVNNTEISSLPSKKLDHFRGQQIGFVMQQNYFVSSLSVLDNIVLASWLVTKKQNVAKAKGLLETLDLSSELYRLPAQLSVGQQQRVSIARALINEPTVVLADEPTSSLDDENALIVADLLANLTNAYKAALVIVTHDKRLKDRFDNQIILR
jgi:putative ABC transport system ATP-binding protein